jgi:hypothetical protein
VAPLPRDRFFHATVTVGSAVYVLGGRRGLVAKKEVFKFDSISGTWSEAASMPEARSFVAACVFLSDIYIFVGRRYNCDQPQRSVLRFNTESNEWSTLAPMPFATYRINASVLNGLFKSP